MRTSNKIQKITQKIIFRDLCSIVAHAPEMHETFNCLVGTLRTSMCNHTTKER